MIVGREWSYLNTTVNGDIDVVISYDGVLIVDGREVCNIFDIIKQINDRLLDEVDELKK
jgi:hypothetical protein